MFLIRAAAVSRSLLVRPSVARSSCSSSSSDAFGSLTPEASVFNRRHDLDEDPKLHADGEAEYEAKLADTFRPKPTHFRSKMSKAVYQKQNLREGLELLDQMKRDLVRPGEPHFRILIHACGKAGYTKKAFELYREYTSRRLGRNQGIIADLFNSVALTPFPEYGLKMAKRLRDKMQRENVALKPIVYINMIRAFGRCGDLQSAFSLLDEMKRNRVVVNTTTYNALLEGRAPTTLFL